MKNQKMTSYQFMMLMQQLPNPMTYVNSHRMAEGTRIKVAHCFNPINPIVHEFKNGYLPKSTPSMELTEVVTVEFELVPNNNIWYWQPVEPITIITLDKKEYIKNWE
jgi:hypothetical protein